MKLSQRVTNAFNAFTSGSRDEKQNNNLAADFLRYGNKTNPPMYQDWSQVEMSDRDMYTGYSYAAIKKRANRAAILGKNFLFTKAAPTIMDAAKVKDISVIHPYLTLIESSKDFTEKKFWHDISTYLDLEGIYYLMAVRAVGTKADGTPMVGDIQKFVMLNPYNVTRVIRESDGTVGGYVESTNGLYREIPKEMIIEIRLLNPFNNDDPYSMTDAAKENQFTMKQAGDYTRHSIRGNINAPGAITTDVVLEDQIFENFVSRIKNHTKGEPIYGNGAGAVNWASMQIDMDKAALDKINEIHRSTLFAVSGTSKTIMGIEESGTGREVSKTQKDDFTENAVMPQIEDIIDALNLDYRKWYDEWETNRYEIALDNPLESDRDAELKDIEIRQTEHDMVVALVNMGYEFDLAVKYAHGDITLAELGEPTLEPQLTPQEAAAQAAQAVGLPAPGTADGSSGNEPNPTNEPNPPVGNTPAITNDTSAVKTIAVHNALTAVKFVKPEENEKIRKAAMKEAEKLKKKYDKEEEERKKKGKKVTDLPDETKPKAGDTVIPPAEKPPLVTVEVKTPNELDAKLKTINQIAARDYPDLYDGMGIDMESLGCIMLDTELIPVAQYIQNPDDDLVDKPGYGTSLASENEAHVTLLFGLLQNGNIWKDKVDMLLQGWSCSTVTINRVSYFDLGDSYAIVALVEKTPELVDGHERLTLLPHINTFSDYVPHITLAYIKSGVDPEKWVKPLNKKYAGQKVATKAINYGDKPEVPAEDDYYDEEDDYAVDSATTDPTPVISLNKEAKQALLTPIEPVSRHIHHNHANDTNSTLEKAKNALEPDTRDRVILSESSLYSAVANLEKSVAQEIIAKYQAGRIKEANDLLTASEKKRYKAELAVALSGFYTVLYPIYAGQLFSDRATKFNKQAVFAMTDDVEHYIDSTTEKAADSHINTILGDLQDAVITAHATEAERELVNLITVKVSEQSPSVISKLPSNPNREDIVKAVKKGQFDNSALYKKAQDLARQGQGLDAITTAIRKEYQDISKGRARTIARHETNRVFNMAQFQADKQFLVESGLISRAYKRLYNRAHDPCPVCEDMIEETNRHPIPFNDNFANLGDTLTATYRKDNGKMAVQKIPVDYEPISAGNIHVNCRCEYELVIKQEDGSWLNSIDSRVVGNEDYAENGGQGSGNWGHAGRLGVVGGSGDGGSGGIISPEGSAYPGRKKGESFTSYAYRYFKENPEIAKEKYNSRIMREFNTKTPNIVSADDAKFVIPGFNPERSADYHEPASGFAKDRYKEYLANESTRNLPVIFTAGGTGAGKSTALRNVTDQNHKFAAVYDGNMAGYESAVGKIEAAKATGRNVTIWYVDRDPVTAFKYGVIPRIKSEGRAITIKDHIQTHLDSRAVVSKIAKTYANDPSVQVHVMDNNGGLGEQHEVSVDNLTSMNYNSSRLKETLTNAATEARQSGQITDSVYRVVTNTTIRTEDNGVDTNEHQGSQTGTGVHSTAGGTGTSEEGQESGREFGGIDADGNAIPVYIEVEDNGKGKGNWGHAGRKGLVGGSGGGGGGAEYSETDAAKELVTIDKGASKINSFKALKAHNDKIQKVYDKYHEANGVSTDDAVRLMGDWTSGPASAVKQFEGELGKKDKGILALDYKLTQAYFKAKGVKTVKLSRGVFGDQGKQLKSVQGKADEVSIKGDNAASWTDSDTISERFAGNTGAIITRSVPVENIIATHQTNPGLAKFGENEFIVSDPKGYSVTGKDVSTL